MTGTRSWREMYAWIGDLLVRRTGRDVSAWNARIREQGFGDAANLRRWLTDQGVTGYPQSLLVMERFGYPDRALAPPDELIERQCADRSHLRPILEAIVAHRSRPARRPGTQGLRDAADAAPNVRVDRADDKEPRRPWPPPPGEQPRGRLEPAKSMGQSTMTARIGLFSPDDVDDEVADWLGRAYQANS
jgi:hypothetical protein